MTKADFPKIPDKIKEEREKERIEGIKKTAVSGIFGIFAGIISFYLAGEGQVRAGFGLTILLFAILIQKYIYPSINVTGELKANDWLYIGFMTLSFWFVSWTLMLN
ncbi:MAG TPA: hypothetical protein HA232_02205 [Methanocellales archaeon]|nr:hypothetical protein [Methanocellales archaeon]